MPQPGSGEAELRGVRVTSTEHLPQDLLAGDAALLGDTHAHLPYPELKNYLRSDNMWMIHPKVHGQAWC